MAIVSGGEIVLSDLNSPWTFRTAYQVPSGINLTRQFAGYSAIYKAQLWVFTLVRKRALATRRLPLKVYQRATDGREEARDSPYARLLRNPNPKHSASFLWEWTSSTLDLFGEAMWLKVRGRDRVPAEVWPLHPANVRVEKSDTGTLSYIYGPGVLVGVSDPQYVIPAADVVHFRTYNPETTVRGMSPIEPLRQTLLNEDAARRASSAFWNNGGRPSGFLSHPRKLSPEAEARLKAQWDEIHSGVDNFGKFAILEEGMEPKILSLTAEDAQYVESRKLNREEVCAAYDVPPPVVHILDRATFSNITEQMRSMYRDTMAPHLGGLEATLDFELRPDFGDDSLYAEFLMDEVLRGDFETRIAAMATAIQTGQLMPSEARQMENRPFVDGSDQLYVNSTIIPIVEVSSRTSATEPAVTPAATGPAPLPASTDVPGAKNLVRMLMGRTSRATTLAELDVKSFTDGLNGHAELVTGLLEKALADGDDMDQFRRRIRTALEGAQ